ncbi:hypothetical protein GCWU000325_02275 [Alloprevotella tannerae ATCC 51259]|uniref:Uncharacterized protein n=1 Tax=Alloprevotella tannerae ATCC 51259 TaxID=626522 RepID=C9LJ63_9BACT|nr:hypothetical protein GCWU000325_02275 [Alloprevotella tannerae ATCC 51259]
MKRRHSVVPDKKLHLAKAAFSPDESAAFSYFVENGPLIRCAGIRIVQTFTYDRKKFLR